MSATFAQLRQKFSEAIGDWLPITTTSAGGAGGDTFISTDLATQGLTDDAWKFYWALPTSGTYAGVERMVSLSVKTTSTATVGRPWAGQIASAVTMELHKVKPSLIMGYMNRALERSFPWLALAIDDRNLITNNLIPNGSFDSLVSPYPTTVIASVQTLDKWQSSASTIVSQWEEPRLGRYAARIASVGGATYNAMWISDKYYPKLKDLAGKTVTFTYQARTYSVSKVKLRVITVDGAGTSVTSDAAYNGGAYWEKVSLTVTLPAVITSINIQWIIDTDGTVYIDDFQCLTPTYELLLNTAIDTVLQVNLADNAALFDMGVGTPWTAYKIIKNNQGKFIHWNELPGSGKLVQLLGYGRHATITGDTTVVDMTDGQLNVIIDGAKSEYFNALAGTLKGKDRSDAVAEGDRCERRFQAGLLSQATAVAGFRMPTDNTTETA